MADTAPQEETRTPLQADRHPPKSNSVLKQRMRRNRAIAVMVIGFCVLIYLVTILRLAASVSG
ncbi:MAG: hypothetical protein AAFW83_00185 [Pseudomonadota bacterium]